MATVAMITICLFSSSVLASDMPLKKSDAQMQMTGSEIVMESLRRHELYPYVYEEQTLVLMDAKQRRDVRRIQRYSRLGQAGVFKAMIKFTYPASIAGAALLFTRQDNGVQNSHVYLPAVGKHLIDYHGGVAGSQVLGSEFSLEELMPEDMQFFDYHRRNDVMDGDMTYFVVQAVSRVVKKVHRTYAMRKLLIRQDNFFVTHIDYFDQKGNLVKRQTRHDIHQVNGEMWRADVIMVENKMNHHRSILKIDRRVYSSDYVPESMFEESAFTPVHGTPSAESSGDKAVTGSTYANPEEVP